MIVVHRMCPAAAWQDSFLDDMSRSITLKFTADKISVNFLLTVKRGREYNPNYDNRNRVQSPIKWDVQIAGVFFIHALGKCPPEENEAYRCGMIFHMQG